MSETFKRALEAIVENAESYTSGFNKVEYHNAPTAIKHLGIIAHNALVTHERSLSTNQE